MVLPFLVQLLIGVALSVAAYMLRPQPKQPQPPETSDLEEPQASADTEIYVLFGTKTIRGANLIGSFDKESRVRTTRQKKK